MEQAFRPAVELSNIPALAAEVNSLSRTQIMIVYVLVDLLIVAAVLWAAFFARWPAHQFFVPAALLFVLNGAWLVWMTLKHTPPGSS